MDDFTLLADDDLTDDADVEVELMLRAFSECTADPMYGALRTFRCLAQGLETQTEVHFSHTVAHRHLWWHNQIGTSLRVQPHASVDGHWQCNMTEESHPTFFLMAKLLGRSNTVPSTPPTCP